jgi:hypothetical protein
MLAFLSAREAIPHGQRDKSNPAEFVIPCPHNQDVMYGEHLRTWITAFRKLRHCFVNSNIPNVGFGTDGIADGKLHAPFRRRRRLWHASRVDQAISRGLVRKWPFISQDLRV